MTDTEVDYGYRTLPLTRTQAIHLTHLIRNVGDAVTQELIEDLGAILESFSDAEAEAEAVVPGPFGLVVAPTGGFDWPEIREAAEAGRALEALSDAAVARLAHSYRCQNDQGSDDCPACEAEAESWARRYRAERHLERTLDEARQDCLDTDEGVIL